MANWTGFSKKSPKERLELLRAEGLITKETWEELNKEQTLPLAIANQMVENVLGTLALPYALLPEIEINGQDYQVPMVTEEPSVVLAASYAAKLIKRSGGFQAKVHQRLMIGQVALYQIPDLEQAQQALTKTKIELLEIATLAHPSIVKRGGGPRELTWQVKEDFLIVYLHIDPCEAMGANMLNTMLEALTPRLETLTGGLSLMAILSNYATESLVTASCSLDFRFLSRDKKEAQILADKMALASQLAQIDPYRATTHNKGIFNGIDAVVLATGNDWRAIEAGCHTYASRNGHYRGLSTWTVDQDKQQINGQLTLPMPIATKGGSIGLNPTVAASFDLLGKISAKELAQVIVSVGLAQNFAALKALVSTGIQQGHMKLQAKSLALQAGAKEQEVALVSQQLIAEKNFSLARAQEMLQSISSEKNT